MYLYIDIMGKTPDKHMSYCSSMVAQLNKDI